MKKQISFAALAILIGFGVVMYFGLQTQNAVATNSVNNADGSPGSLRIATFAGGCFWCVESTFEKHEGVIKAVSGYAGGHTDNPNYQQVGGGDTGHTETVQIYYDPAVISYDALLHYFWREIDPTDSKGQFVDRGSMYRPAVFYHNQDQKQAVEKSIEDLKTSARFSNPIVVEVLPFESFYDGEGYHQDYYKKSPFQYKIYRLGSGRDQFLEKVWGDSLHEKYPHPVGASNNSATSVFQTADSTREYAYSKPTDTELKQQLTELQYKVTQHEGTERPFTNAYWDHKEEGIYVDVTSGEPLFSSTDKYKSGTGWPSFSKPIDKHFIVDELDFKLGLPRTEVRSKYGDAHLGHVFKDGPAPTGLRYCINSASLDFVPKSDLVSKGYGEFNSLFF